MVRFNLALLTIEFPRNPNTHVAYQTALSSMFERFCEAGIHAGKNTHPTNGRTFLKSPYEKKIGKVLWKKKCDSVRFHDIV